MQKINGEIVDAIGPIAHKWDTLVICVVHIAVIAVAGELQHIGGHPVIPVSAPALLGYGARFVIYTRGMIGGKMPFPHVGRSIARLVEALRQRFHAAERQRAAVDLAAHLGGVTSRLQAGTRRTAHRLAGKRIFIPRPVRRQCVQIRRYPQRLPVTAQRIPALLIGKIKNNIRSAHICPSHCGLGRRIRTTTPSVKQSAAYW